MESLLCNEMWPMTEKENDGVNENSFDSNTKLDCEESLAAFLAKESSYLPRSGYSNLVDIHDSIANARFKAVAWIIKSQGRMDLRAETVFGAVNYLDRFISSIQCQEWKPWMFELLSIACLSIAAKFKETSSYSLHQFQEDLETSYALNLIQQMEVTVLKSLEWRLNSITPFSYIYPLVTLTTHAGFSKQDLTNCVTQLLLHLLLDAKFLEFRHCVVAISALKAVMQDLLPPREDDPSFSYLETLVPQHHKDGLIHCQRLMRKLLVRSENNLLLCGISPSSPVTVLKVDLFNSSDEFRGGAAFSLMMTTVRLSQKRNTMRVKVEVRSLCLGSSCGR